ncbi:DUF4197 domain-containing protein [Sediminicola luteus]|uniref:DUF4197 domain-containing protein n=1 Tax=Sediminicola luteus TaxID=319238 RepID=A0A2A4G8K6_9FLAO|nr:DUF4197 domain-containing protein [Sediminicola luteus]PCE64326.1 hypothetical protein B7P33_08490 [Sediminicola luteus]
MFRKSLLFFALLTLASCGELQTVLDSLPQGTTLGNDQIAQGLKQALDKGIDEQVSRLTQKDGFYTNQLVKIGLPDELKTVDQTLRKIGLGKLADEGIKALNRTAENAVKEATPIFINAVSEISFNDAKTILLGNQDAATQYLKGKTTQPLYAKFHPVINDSFKKVGADQVWSNLIQKYNTIPLVEKVNPDLTDYVTQEALEGVFTMIAVEEKEIRTKVSARTTQVLQQVFAMQDGH